MFENIRADLERARIENGVPPGWINQFVRTLVKPTTVLVLLYRFGHWARSIRTPVVRQIMMITAAILRRPCEALTGTFIAPDAEIGPGFVIHNLYGILIGRTRIGANFLVHTGCLVSYLVLRIGDNVVLGPGAKILEETVVGSNVRVLANSVVITDVPDNMTVAGVPARIRLRKLAATSPSKPVSGDNGIKGRGSAVPHALKES